MEIEGNVATSEITMRVDDMTVCVCVCVRERERKWSLGYLK